MFTVSYLVAIILTLLMIIVVGGVIMVLFYLDMGISLTFFLIVVVLISTKIANLGVPIFNIIN